jgi:hypothetical protein
MCKDKNGAKERFTYIFTGMKQSQCHFDLGFNTFRHLVSIYIFPDEKLNEYTVTTNLIQPLTPNATQSQQDRIFCDTHYKCLYEIQRYYLKTMCISIY